MDKDKIIGFHRESIIKAADELFIEFGKDGTTINMIAKLANYSTATIYVYFKNKDEIFSCLIYQCMLKVKEIISGVADNEGEFEGKYFRICNALVDMQDQYPLYFEGMIGHINMDFESSNTPEIYRDIFNLGNKINQVLIRIIDQGINANYLDKDIDKKMTIFYLWASLTGIVRMIKQKNDYFMLNNVTRTSLLKFSFQNIFNGIKYIGA
jgi:AcrR family transcriptional regulator